MNLPGLVAGATPAALLEPVTLLVCLLLHAALLVHVHELLARQGPGPMWWAMSTLVGALAWRYRPAPGGDSEGAARPAAANVIDLSAYRRAAKSAPSRRNKS